MTSSGTTLEAVENMSKKELAALITKVQAELDASNLRELQDRIAKGEAKLREARAAGRDETPILARLAGLRGEAEVIQGQTLSLLHTLVTLQELLVDIEKLGAPPNARVTVSWPRQGEDPVSLEVRLSNGIPF